MDHVEFLTQAQECQNDTSSRGVLVNGHPKDQMGWHQNVVLDEKWWKSNKMIEKILKGTKWRYLSKTPKCLGASMEIDVSAFHILWSIGKGRRRHTFSSKGFWNYMGRKKSESLDETIWNSSLLLTLRPVSISMACPDSYEHYLHWAARNQGQRGPGASSEPFQLFFVMVNVFLICNATCTCAEKHQRAANSGEVSPERHHKNGASPEML